MWGAVIVSAFQDSELQLPLGLRKRQGVRQETGQEAAWRQYREEGGGNRTVPKGIKLFKLWPFRRGGARPNNKEN